MALVTVMKLDKHSGALISDEERWAPMFRRTFFSRNLHLLIERESGNGAPHSALLGWVKNPGASHEIASSAKKTLSDAERVPTVYEVTRVVLDSIRDAVRRRVDDSMRFLYGFTSVDLKRGSFTSDGKKYDIKQGSVKKRAMNMMTWKDKNNAMKKVYGNQAVVAGYDPTHGFNCYALDLEEWFFYLMPGIFESIGPGKDLSVVTLARFLNSMTLEERKRGIDRVKGMIELIHSAGEAATFNHEVGGYTHIVYVNGNGKEGERLIEVSGHPAKVAGEVVFALKQGFLTERTGHRLVEEIIYEGAPFEEVEEAMFTKAKKGALLEKLLRGYKFSDFAVKTIRKGPYFLTGGKKGGKGRERGAAE
jgi:hypothetical protein